ncbi:Hsp20/alpha crystallin family protein [Caballeronia ptereochthonis]|uniref:Hsp20/alpha crystallin family protein n=1 Tax=Caballeronia ptereochthonis TaxID=1777144 RepID=UPI000B35869B|nr:Hsp20/alpha crystallin family protein [Caballeronia ptereochthonis]
MTITHHARMWEAAVDALERAARLHRQFFRLAGQRAQEPVWEPPIEFFEDHGRLSIVVALPGVKPDLIHVSLENDTLIVTAERRRSNPLSKGTVHCFEIPYGRFERQVRLPAGRYRLVRRDSEHGCLLLDIETLD